MCKDLAQLCCTIMPEFRVAVLGRGTIGGSKHPWTSYSYPAETGGWGQDYIAGVTKDFFGSEHGILFSNWDISRLTWLPTKENRNYSTWLYTPIDSLAANGRAMTYECQDALRLFDRISASSEWGQQVLKVSGRTDADFLPHGLFMNVFKPMPGARKLLNWSEDDIFVGFVAANQSRKDFPVAFETFMLLRQKYGPRFRGWVHTDKLIHAWNVYALSRDFGLDDCLQITTNATDEMLALRYSACDCTILPSGGEGFGFPVAESLACGTPCIVANYAAAQEIVPEECRVHPVTYRVDTVYNSQRAVLSGYGFARAAEEQIDKKRCDWEYRGEELREGVRHLGWDRLQFPWRRWFADGLR